MITSKKQLKFYIMADRIMNGLTLRSTLKEKIINLVTARPESKVLKYIISTRKLSYYRHQKGVLAKIMMLLTYRKCCKLTAVLGCFISEDVFRYGLVIPHHGTLRVGNKNKVGRYAVIHTVVNMTASQVTAGDGLYLSVGSKVIGPVTLGNNVTVAANSVVHKSCGDNCLLAGMPATVKKEDYKSWYERDGEEYVARVRQVEALREKMGLPEDI